jgi:hypothetical protein
MAPSERPGAVDLPTIGTEPDADLPYSELLPGDIQEPVEPKRRSGRRRWVRPLVAVVAIGGLGALVAVAWPSGGARHESTATVPEPAGPVAAPTTTVVESFASTARPDGWFDVASNGGGIHLQLPARPTVRSSNGEGTVSLVADLPGGGHADLLWAPLTSGLPRTLAPFLAMTGAMDRYPGIQGSAMRVVDGKAIIDGTRTTSSDQLRARVTATEHFAFIVVLVEPRSVDDATFASTWSRVRDSLSVAG